MVLKKTLKYLYNALPLKKEIYSMIKLFGVPSESIYKHLTFTGFFTVKTKENKTFKLFHTGNIEENEIFWNGLYNGWERKSMSIWAELCKSANNVLDIGANTGLYGLVAKTQNPNATVHCFEPIPGVCKFLTKNIEANHYDIKKHCIGLSDYDGIAKIYLPNDKDFAYSVTINKNTLNDSSAKELEVKVRKLSGFIEENRIESIDLMKVDVETHEFEVLVGMGNYLKEFKPAMIIEVLNDEIAEKLNMLFRDMQYLYFNIDDRNNSIRKQERLTKSDHWNFLVCNESVAKSLNLI